MKKVEIIGSLNDMTVGTRNCEIFDQERYKKDFEKLLNDTFFEYEITYSLDEVDMDEILIYPYILGDIGKNEKNRIVDILMEDPFLTYFADHDYFSPIVKMDASSLNEPSLDAKYINQTTSERTTNHKDDSQCIINGTCDLSDFKERSLTSIEMCFLKYISGLKTHLKFISGEWTFNYHLDFQDVLNQFVVQKLVEIVELDCIEKLDKILTIEDLGKILQTKNLEIRGKKADLIEKLIKNSSDIELEEYTARRYIKYSLTEYGRALTGPINPSITRDMEFEDKCYWLVMNNSFDIAYIAINDFREKYHINIGLSFVISLGGRHETDIGTNDTRLLKYRKLTGCDLGLPEALKVKQKSVISCIIVGDMFNSSDCKISDLVIRIVDTGLTKKQIVECVECGRSLLKQF